MNWLLLLDTRDALKKARIVINQRIEEVERVQSHFGFWSVDIAERKIVAEIDEVITRINIAMEAMNATVD